MAWLVGLWFGDSGMRLGDDTTPPECPGLDGHEYLPLAGGLGKRFAPPGRCGQTHSHV